MLPKIEDYDELYREFRWRIPERFNIGVAVTTPGPRVIRSASVFSISARTARILR